MSNVDIAAPAATPVTAPANQTPPNTPPAGDQKADALENQSTPTPDAQNADGGEAPANDAGATEQQAHDEERKRRRRDRVQERINEAVAAQRAAERQRDELVQKVLNGELKPEPKAAAQTGQSDLKEPDEKAFSDYGEYLKARDDYLVERTRRAVAKEIEDKRKSETTAQSHAERVAKAQEAKARFDEAAEKELDQYEDADDVLDELWHPDGTKLDFMRNDAVAEYCIEQSERGFALIHHLRANPKEAKRIASLSSPVAITRELTRLEASLPKPQARKVSKAPEPPKEVGGKGGADKKAPADMTIDEMRKATGLKRRVDY